MNCLKTEPLDVRGLVYQRCIRSLALGACVACITFLLCHSLGAQTSVIVSVSNEKKLVVYSLDDSGTLGIESETQTSGKPGCSTASRDGKFLYVAMKATNSIAAYSFDHKMGLKLLGDSYVGAAASYLTIDATGEYLFSSYYKDGKIALHRIKNDGTLGDKPLEMIETDEKAHCIALDPSGKFVFVPHTGPNAIFQFVFEAQSGKITPNEKPKLVRAKGTGPRHLCFHPESHFAYGSDEQGSSVTVYRIDRDNGTLSVLQTLSTLPEGFEGKNSTSDIEVHPSNKFVFVANRGSDTIASFTIDAETGLLSLLEHSETVPFTRSFNISADGKYLVAAGQKSNKIRMFAIRGDGKTELLSTTDTGEAPWWVQIIQNNSIETARFQESEFIGDWSLKLESGTPAWMSVKRLGDDPEVTLRLHVGPGGPHKDVKVQDGRLTFTLRQKKKNKTVRTADIGIVDGKLEGTIMTTSAGGVVKRDRLTGKKIPSVPATPPDLSKVTFGKPITLFNGKDLTGWRPHEADKKMGWSVKDGLLVNTTPKTDFSATGAYANLDTEGIFEDFRLHIEFLIEKNRNSGIYLRGMYEAQVVDRDSRMQGLQGVGAIFGRIKPTKNASKPGGQWQTYDLTLVDRHITVVLNGEKVIDNQPVHGPTAGAVFTDPTQPGPIHLQGDHTNVKYRNIYLEPVTTANVKN